VASSSSTRPAVPREASLAALHPDIAATWHPTKNGDLTPADVLPTSYERVFWQCPHHPTYAWQTQVRSRLRARRCLACAGQIATPETSLRARRPDVAARWHPTLNGALTPDDVMPGSGRAAFWQCAVDPGHVWKASVSDVSTARRGGCPFCSGRRATPATSLLDCFPEVAAQWHPTKNGALGPADVTWSCSRRVFWRCETCHYEWQSSIYNRGKPGTGNGCPACSGRVATPANSLLALRPELAREWHPTLNGALTPDDLRPGSDRRIAWQCAAAPSHTWWTSPNARTNMGSGCPFCAGHRAAPDTSLAALHPRLSREWHPKLNAPLTPHEVRPGTSRKVWWRCHRDASHVWESAIAPRALQGVGCPFCSHTVVSPRTSLAAQHPDVAAEWHPTLNQPLQAEDVLPGSGKRVWWRCAADPEHAWEASVYNRTSAHPTGCPICSGRVATEVTSLRARNPELAAQWHPTRNRPLTPDDVVPGSNRRVWWRCPAGRTHLWQTTVSNRARRGDGCPHCAGRHRKKKQA
jgi:hypothetical protein